MNSQADSRARRNCKCLDCEDTRRALALLDNIATSDAGMGSTDIDWLCSARTLLARIVGSEYTEETNRHD